MKKIISIIISFLSVFQIFAGEKNLLRKESFDKGTFKNLNFDLSFEEITFEKTYSDELTVEIYSNNRKKVPTYEIADNTLNLKSTTLRTYAGDLCKIHIYVPEDFTFENITISTKSGDIDADSLHTNLLSLKTNSGSIEVDDVFADEELALNSLSGEISVEDVITKNTKIESSSGEIEIEKLGSEDLAVNSISGKIFLNNYKGEYIFLKSNSGRIEATSVICDYFTIESTSGSISFELKSAIKAASSITSTSGRVNLFVPEECGFDLIASSNSGRFDDEILDADFTPRQDFTNSYYGGGPEITIKTVSGGINLDN